MGSCKWSRREFLVLSAGAAAAAGCGLGSGSSSQSGDVALGTASSLAVGQVRVASDASCVLMHDSGGLYALSLTCTHAGCNIYDSGTVSAQRLVCACHQSAFGPNGERLSGPASQPLPHYALTVDSSGNVTVHVGQEVAASTRTPV